MPAFYRLAEVAVYSLLNFLPFAILALYLFRRNLRVSLKRVILFVFFISLVQIGIGIRVALFPGAYVSIISLLSTLLYSAAFLYVVTSSVGKSLFILLMLSNLENYIVVTSKCLEGVLFPTLARQPYRWSFSLCMVIVLFALSAPLHIYFKRIIAPVIALKHDSLDWRFLWLLPAVFYFIWYYSIYLINASSSIEMALRPRNTIVFTIINLGALLVYFVVSRLLLSNEQNRILEAHRSVQTVQTLQYEKVHEKILETRRARHDLRHHLAVLNGFTQNRDYEKLEAYLKEYTQSVQQMSDLTLCNNAAINLILLYFSDLAENNDIDFQVSARISEDIPIPETDLTVLFGNLLENASDACMEQQKIACTRSGEVLHGAAVPDLSPEHSHDEASAGSRKPSPRIIVRIEETPAYLYFTIDNTFHGSLKTDKKGQYLSTKHKGNGIGIDSCRSIVDQYNGTFQIKKDDDMIYVSVLLSYPPREAQ